MARTFDYSKWDNIELSDDESDLHPNIDKESWFRMKHRARYFYIIKLLLIITIKYT